MGIVGWNTIGSVLVHRTRQGFSTSVLRHKYISTHLTPRYQTIHISALYALHFETFWSSSFEKFWYKTVMQKNSGLNRDVNVKTFNMTIICCEFSAVNKKINGFSTVNCSKWHHSHQGRQLTLWVMLRQHTTLITELTSALCSTLFSINLQFAKMRAFSLHYSGFDLFHRFRALL